MSRTRARYCAVFFAGNLNSFFLFIGVSWKSLVYAICVSGWHAQEEEEEGGDRTHERSEGIDYS
jgi:hypothetical protein